jgi:hypothetical protein
MFPSPSSWRIVRGDKVQVSSRPAAIAGNCLGSTNGSLGLASHSRTRQQSLSSSQGTSSNSQTLPLPLTTAIKLSQQAAVGLCRWIVGAGAAPQLTTEPPMYLQRTVHLSDMGNWRTSSYVSLNTIIHLVVQAGLQLSFQLLLQAAVDPSPACQLHPSLPCPICCRLWLARTRASRARSCVWYGTSASHAFLCLDSTL